MKRIQPLILFVAFLLIQPELAAAPVVTNIAASQRNGTLLVDITYDLAAPGVPAVAVTLEISSDGGVTWTVPSDSATGDVGAAVAPGTGKAIVWDAGADWGGNYSAQMRFRVVADDGVPDGFALIPSGSFTMGRTSGDTDSNAPPITVSVSAFYMAETETTKAQWDEVRTWATSNGYSDLAVGAGKAADHPVHTVSWWDVVKWCNARSEKEGLTPVYTVGGNVMRTGTTAPVVDWTANGYRLPTEAEWEKAARGGVSGKRFPWGTDTISHAEANYRGSTTYPYDQSPINNYHPTYATGGLPYTSPVGSFAANGYGMKDMAGNVWEWCWDWYGSSYYTTSNGTTNPRGPATGSGPVIRGSSWNLDAISARCSLRDFFPQSGASTSIGFRTARASLCVPYIPGGAFTMGRTSGDTDGNAPPITVTVSAFYMAHTETTKAQWDEVRTWAIGNGYTDLAVGAGKAADHPVHTVSWFDVVKWCNARSEKEGLTPVYTVGGNVMRTGTTDPDANWNADGYRLPTEAEWEKAARGGVSAKRFPSGKDTISHVDANYRGSTTYTYDLSLTNNTHPTYASGSPPYTSPVGSFAANGYCMKDMAGNVNEWCWDWYEPNFYVTSNGTTDPRGPAMSANQWRVIRPGTWDNGAVWSRCSARLYNLPQNASNYTGFRTARRYVP